MFLLEFLHFIKIHRLTLRSSTCNGRKPTLWIAFQSDKCWHLPGFYGFISLEDTFENWLLEFCITRDWNPSCGWSLYCEIIYLVTQQSEFIACFFSTLRCDRFDIYYQRRVIYGTIENRYTYSNTAIMTLQLFPSLEYSDFHLLTAKDFCQVEKSTHPRKKLIGHPLSDFFFWNMLDKYRQKRGKSLFSDFFIFFSPDKTPKHAHSRFN